MKRCFISINVSEEVKKEIKKVQDELPEFVGKKTEIENLHLTLKFLGEIDEEKVEEVRKKLREIKIKKFETKIDSVGMFGFKIIWLHLIGCDELQKEIDESLKGLFKPEKRFMSHLTIARVKKVEDKKRFLDDLRKIKVPEVKFIVDKFCLMESVLGSNGPTYTVIKEYDLE